METLRGRPCVISMSRRRTRRSRLSDLVRILRIVLASRASQDATACSWNRRPHKGLGRPLFNPFFTAPQLRGGRLRS